MSDRRCAAKLALVLLTSCPAMAEDFGFVLETQWQAAGAVEALAFASDGSWLAVATGRETALYTLAGDGAVPGDKLVAGRRGVLDLAVGPGGEMVAAVDAAGALRLYRVPGGEAIAVVDDAHRKKAVAVSFTADGRYVLTGGGDGSVKAWTSEGRFFAELDKGARHEDAIVMVAGVPPERRALTVGKDRRIILWDVDTQTAIRPTSVDMDVRSASVGGAGRVLALGLELLRAPLFRSQTMANAHVIEATDTIRLIDAERGTQMRELEGESQEINALGVTPDGRFLASAGSEAEASIWDTATGRLVTRIPFDAPVTALAFSADGKRLASATRDGLVSLYALAGVGPSPVPMAPGKIIIIIIEPSGLSAGRAGDVTQVESSALRLRGRVKSTRPLKSLMVDGRQITSLVSEDDALLFTAAIPLTRAGRRQIEIVAEDQAGAVARETFVVERRSDVPPRPIGEGRRLALIVGISEYRDPTVNLQYADEDARAIYELITSPRLGPAAFDAQDVMLLLNSEATATRINTGLREFLQRARENDFVLFFFAGHGVPDPNRLQDLYLMAHDTDPERVAGTGLLMRHVREAIAAIRARDVLILTDACHSAGMSAPASIRSLTVNPIHEAFLEGLRHASGGLAILTASEAAQVSIEGPEWEGHGVFSYYLLRGLRGGADDDGDRIVSLGEIMEYVRDKVKRETEGLQVPSIGPTSFDRTTPLMVVPQ